MFKWKLTKEEFDVLTEEHKAMYKEAGDGYQIQIDGMPDIPDVSGLQKKVDELLSEKKSEQEKRRQAEEAAKKAAEEQARKTVISNHWKRAGLKNSAPAKRVTDTVTGKRCQPAKLLVDNVAQSLATKLAGDSAALIVPHIKSRLAVEDGKTRVVDATGQLSALTIDELEKNSEIISYLRRSLSAVRQPEPGVTEAKTNHLPEAVINPKV